MLANRCYKSPASPITSTLNVVRSFEPIPSPAHERVDLFYLRAFILSFIDHESVERKSPNHDLLVKDVACCPTFSRLSSPNLLVRNGGRLDSTAGEGSCLQLLGCRDGECLNGSIHTNLDLDHVNQ